MAKKVIKVYYNTNDGTIVATRRDDIKPKGFDDIDVIEVKSFDYSKDYLVIDKTLSEIEKEKPIINDEVE